MKTADTADCVYLTPQIARFVSCCHASLCHCHSFFCWYHCLSVSFHCLYSSVLSDLGTDVGNAIGGRIITEISNYMNNMLGKVEEGERAMSHLRSSLLDEVRRSVSKIDEYTTSQFGVVTSIKDHDVSICSLKDCFTYTTTLLQEVKLLLESTQKGQADVLQQINSLSVSLSTLIDKLPADNVATTMTTVPLPPVTSARANSIELFLPHTAAQCSATQQEQEGPNSTNSSGKGMEIYRSCVADDRVEREVTTIDAMPFRM